MKKGAVLIGILFLIVTFLMVGILASEETEKVQKAYDCLKTKIDEKTCSGLSTEEKIFSLISTGKCKTELLDDSYEETCWPGSNCNLEITSKATLALNSVGVDTSLPVEWLWEQKGVSKDLNWYLEVDSNRPISCTVGYKTNTIPYEDYSFNVGLDKKIDQNAGTCLKRTNGNFWFSISDSCYESDFSVSCNESFISTLIFKDKSSQTYHISDKVHSSSGGGTTVEKIDSFCLLGGGSCDYAGTLWGSFILDYLDENVSSFFPYLITSALDYQRNLPEAFLYILMNKLEDKTSLLNKQILNKYWRVQGGKGEYYDTALALLPFQGKSLAQKDGTKSWLLNEVQQENGCWDNNNIMTNGFLLYSIWPKDTGGNGGGGDVLCSEVGYECVNSSSDCSGTVEDQYSCTDSNVCCNSDSSTGGGGNECEDLGYTCGFTSSCTGSILSEYSCGAGVQKCCDSSQQQSTCPDLNGLVCSSGQYCSGGYDLSTDELLSGETCCIEGTCEEVSTTNEFTCEDNLGVCSSSCDSGYEESSSYNCESSGDVCCMESSVSSSDGGSYLWIWILLFLVIVVTVAILYKDKIQVFIQKMKSRRKGGGSKGSSPGGGGTPPRFPPAYNRRTRIGPPIQRKMIPRSSPSPLQRTPPRRKSPRELEDVLKKLKEIGK